MVPAGVGVEPGGPGDEAEHVELPGGLLVQDGGPGQPVPDGRVVEAELDELGHLGGHRGQQGEVRLGPQHRVPPG